jgi:hypothetical protein
MNADAFLKGYMSKVAYQGMSPSMGPSTPIMPVTSGKPNQVPTNVVSKMGVAPGDLPGKNRPSTLPVNIKSPAPNAITPGTLPPPLNLDKSIASATAPATVMKPESQTAPSPKVNASAQSGLTVGANTSAAKPTTDSQGTSTQ